MAVLVTGGAGYIGSHAVKLLGQRGYRTVVYDNLIYGHRQAILGGDFVEGDLHDTARLVQVLKQYHITDVMHFAAFAYVGESVQDPLKYYANNVAGTLSLLQAMRTVGVQHLIFSSTCAVFGTDYDTPDGTCIRDYIHVNDLADAHILALQALDTDKAQTAYNLGIGTGYSVRQVIETAAHVTGRSIATRIAPRRPGDPPRLVAAADKIRSALGWQPRYTDLPTIIATAWRWECQRRYG